MLVRTRPINASLRYAIPLSPTFGVSPNAITSVHRRHLLTLAIETSCDDTSVAVLETHEGRVPVGYSRASLHHHERLTSNNAAYGGIHPLVALTSHQENLATMVRKAMQDLPHASYEDEVYGRAINAPLRSSLTQSAAEADHSVEEVLKRQRKRKPDFIAVTRGPGMLSNLAVGLDAAKGLAVAWDVPLVGVHHMQAHLLTPRLAHSLEPWAVGESQADEPDFPILSLLVSGGHTLLTYSTSMTEHRVLAQTADIALGDCIDKIARLVLPPAGTFDAQSLPENASLGAQLEAFAFPPAVASKHGRYPYEPRGTLADLLVRRTHPIWGWSFAPPLSESQGGARRTDMSFTFSGLVTAVERIMRNMWDEEADRPSTKPRYASGDDGLAGVSINERRAIGREAMRIAFEHLAARVLLGLELVHSFVQPKTPAVSPRANDDAESHDEKARGVSVEERRRRRYLREQRRRASRASKRTQAPFRTLVVSGGVAANKFLRRIIRATMDASGVKPPVRVVTPPPTFCTDNAAMIAWAGVEMFKAGWRSDLSVRPLRKWSLESNPPAVEEAAEEALRDARASGVEVVRGILGAPGWVKEEARDFAEPETRIPSFALATDAPQAKAKREGDVVRLAITGSTPPEKTIREKGWEDRGLTRRIWALDKSTTNTEEDVVRRIWGIGKSNADEDVVRRFSGIRKSDTEVDMVRRFWDTRNSKTNREEGAERLAVDSGTPPEKTTQEEEMEDCTPIRPIRGQNILKTDREKGAVRLAVESGTPPGKTIPKLNRGGLGLTRRFKALDKSKTSGTPPGKTIPEQKGGDVGLTRRFKALEKSKTNREGGAAMLAVDNGTPPGKTRPEGKREDRGFIRRYMGPGKLTTPHIRKVNPPGPPEQDEISYMKPEEPEGPMGEAVLEAIKREKLTARKRLRDFRIMKHYASPTLRLTAT